MQNLTDAKILLIDDNDTLYNVLQRRLASRGLFLLWASNIEEGYQKAIKHRPALIITDIVMPKGNGFDLIGSVKKNSLLGKTRFMILSDWGEPRLIYDREFWNNLGISRYLIKSNHTPLEILNEIIAVIDEI